MFSLSEIRAAAQDAVIELAKVTEDPEANLVYTGQFVIAGSISSEYPWNADLQFKRSFPAQEPVLAVYIDCSVPGSGFGVWAVRANLDGAAWVYDEDLAEVLEQIGVTV